MDKRERALEQKVLHFIQEHRLVQAGETLVIAVSGGIDSICLLHILVQQQKELGVKLHIAHLNHRLRDAESDADANYVADLACHMGIPITTESRDVAAYQRQGHCSLEEAAREVRYGFLAEVASTTGASGVMVGHTRDDHIETILMHLLRGTGMVGLRGLQPRLELRYGKGRTLLKVVRPLLEITRQEITDYCQRCQLEPRSDSSNEFLYFLRNRIRLELLPVLRSYNSNIDEALLRLAAIADDDVSFIEQQASQLWDDVAEEKKGAIYLDRVKMANLPLAMKRQIFRMAITRLRGDLKDIEAGHIEAAVDFLAKPTGKRLSLPQGLTLSVEYACLILALGQPSLCPLPPFDGVHSINVPGKTILPGWQVKADIIQNPVNGNSSGFVASFDLDKVGRELIVRRRKPGDHFQPLGMNQTKKLQDFMVDAKIPRVWRDRVPLLCSPEQILWIVGWRIDDRVKIFETTRKILRLEFERLD